MLPGVVYITVRVMPSKFEQALLESRRAFRNAAVYETYCALAIEKILAEAKSPIEVAQSLSLNADATSRYLHAVASLGLCRKTAEGKFIAVNDNIVYSNSSSLCLFWLIRNKLPDFLAETPQSLEQLRNKLPLLISNNLMLNTAVENQLLILDNCNNYAVPEETKKFLLSNSSDYIGPMITHFEKIMFPMFSVTGLKGALQTGKSQWGTFFESKVTNPFMLYRDNPLLLETFTQGMHQLNTLDDEVIVNKLPLTNVSNVLDVGGGSGAFAIQLLKQSKSITKIDIYELPDAIPLMQAVFKKYAPTETRVQFIPGSFLEKTSEGGLAGLPLSQLYDLITLAWILHDWSYETNLQILKEVFMHLKPNGRLVILEAILPENRLGEVTMADITMLLQTEGKERTFLEYKGLLQQAGFKEVEWLHTDTRRQALIAH